MFRPGGSRALSEQDHYRQTEPMGRPFDGSVPRYHGVPAGFPSPDSNPYPYGRVTRQPVPSHVVRTPAGRPTPPQPAQPPEPYISQIETARHTREISKDIRTIKWIVLMIFLCLLVLVATDLFISLRINNIITLTSF